MSAWAFVQGICFVILFCREMMISILKAFMGVVWGTHIPSGHRSRYLSALEQRTAWEPTIFDFESRIKKSFEMETGLWPKKQGEKKKERKKYNYHFFRAHPGAKFLFLFNYAMIFFNIISYISLYLGLAFLALCLGIFPNNKNSFAAIKIKPS